MLEITAIPILEDNYVWLLARGDRCVVVDPGEAAPVQAVLAERGLTVDAILLTHHHSDHVGGVEALQAPVVCASEIDARRLKGVTHPVADGATVSVLGHTFRVMATPGHTRGAICYHGSGMVFTGDTLFSSGCGRLFEGTPDEMHASLQTLAMMPETTRVYCGHEYTQTNLRFAKTIEPTNLDIMRRINEVEALRARGEPSLPSTIGIERTVNPFIRSSSAAVFAERRRARDTF